ncbi:MAG: GNAT family N-acetyltransferase [Lacunisphaera sp.]
MPSRSFQLRPARPGDHDLLWQLKQQTMRPYVEKTWHRWIDEEQKEWFTRNFLPEKAQIIVVDGRDAGRLEITRSSRELRLGTIEISPEFQSRGVGAAVVRALQTEAKSASLPLRLQVLKANPRARQLYESLEFRTVGETTTHHLMSWP